MWMNSNGSSTLCIFHCSCACDLTLIPKRNVLLNLMVCMDSLFCISIFSSMLLFIRFLYYIALGLCIMLLDVYVFVVFW